MKKIFAVILVVTLLLVPCVLNVGAAGALSDNEQAILNQLSKTISNGSASYEIPDAYVNQAKAYFLTTDVTDAQEQQILGYISQGESTIKEQMVSGEAFDLKDLPADVKAEVLSLGQQASSVVGLGLVYTSDKQVKITKIATGEVVFNNSPIIKTTGVSGNFIPMVATASVIVLLIGAAFVFSKKSALFVK